MHVIFRGQELCILHRLFSYSRKWEHFSCSHSSSCSCGRHLLPHLTQDQDTLERPLIRSRRPPRTPLARNATPRALWSTQAKPGEKRGDWHPRWRGQATPSEAGPPQADGGRVLIINNTPGGPPAGAGAALLQAPAIEGWRPFRAWIDRKISSYPPLYLQAWDRHKKTIWCLANHYQQSVLLNARLHTRRKATECRGMLYRIPYFFLVFKPLLSGLQHLLFLKPITLLSVGHISLKQHLMWLGWSFRLTHKRSYFFPTGFFFARWSGFSSQPQHKPVFE